MKKIMLLLFAGFISLYVAVNAQKKKEYNKPITLSFDTALYNGMKWRNIGPFRGGRSAAVSGVPGKRNLYYFGSTGGGVWKSSNGGLSWENISDGFCGGSIGAIAVSEADNNVIYVGGGQETLRGNTSFGYGMWKSLDAGKTWAIIGLKGSRFISRIRIHPDNPDIAWVAVIGDIFKPSPERGIYKTTDGGKSWRRVLFVNDRSGAIDLIIDPVNPRILYGSTWRALRTPYSFESGGEGSGLWKSTDEGETWNNISTNEGLPGDTLGIIGIAVSPVNHERVWAIVEARNGGVFRSEDSGKTWKKVNEDRNLRQRAWYYSRIYADPNNLDVVYVMNVEYYKSMDGGATFKAYNAPHGDHHDLWIDPDDSQRMIIADDGGAQVSTDGGRNWTSYYNQPTGEFYRLTTDNHFPYRIYGAQQDNSAVRILHRSNGSTITDKDWEITAGGESGYLAVDPVNDEIVYGGSYDGFMERFDHKNKQSRLVSPWPDNHSGHGAESALYRFQWNYPLFFSPNDTKKLYACSNFVHVSYNEGQSWQVISPDLTRHDPAKMKSSGGPITKDNTGVEYYCTIFAATESFHEPGVIWTGSDDGLVYLTKDGGKNWNNVTPSIMPEWLMINSLEIDPFNKGGLYLAGTLYKAGDYRPYLYKTKDYGVTWESITSGIPAEYFTRVLRADPKRPGLLYCGTETGIFVSFDDGASWQSFQNNLPVVPVTDLAIKNNNLLASTQGRSFWIIDDLTPIRQLDKNIEKSDYHLFTPLDSYRMDGSQNKEVKNEGQNHCEGAIINYYLKTRTDTTTVISIKILENDGHLVKTFSTNSKKVAEKIKPIKGFNLFNWDMRYPDARDFEGMVLDEASLQGPKALPGNYKVRLVVGKDSMEVPFMIIIDPRVSSTREELQEQFDFLISCRDKITETHFTITSIRKLRNDLDELKKRIVNDSTLKKLTIAIDSARGKITRVEESLYQVKIRSSQDALNYPIRLNNKLANLMNLVNYGNSKPTEQEIKLKDEFFRKIDDQLRIFHKVVNEDIKLINKLVHDNNVDIIMVQTR